MSTISLEWLRAVAFRIIVVPNVFVDPLGNQPIPNNATSVDETHNMRRGRLSHCYSYPVVAPPDRLDRSESFS